MSSSYKVYNNKKSNLKKWLYFGLLFLTSLVFIALIVIFSVGGLFAPANYLAVWDKNYYKQFDDTRLQLVSHAILAPNAYNLQSFKVELSKDNKDEFKLFVDTNRLMMVSDVKCREMIISAGSFLQYLQIAGQKLAVDVNITLLPDGELDENNIVSSLQNKALAKVVVSNENKNSNLLKYYKTIFKRSTNRGAYNNEKLKESEIDKIIQLNTFENVNLKVTTDDTVNASIADLNNKALLVEMQNPVVLDAYISGTRLNEYDKNKNPYGFSVTETGDGKVMTLLKQGVVTLFPNLLKPADVKKEQVTRSQKNLNNMPNAFTIYSNDNTTTTQIKTGMLYALVELEFQNLGYVVQPISRIISDYPQIQGLKTEFENMITNGKPSQMFCRVGKAKTTEYKTMRFQTPNIVVEK